MHSVFEWAVPDLANLDAALRSKTPYLNVQFFAVRFGVFFLVWFFFYAMLIGNSAKQDATADQKLTTRNIKLSAAFMPVFAITLTFFSVDWLMSLEPRWYSTMFGAYYFSGTFLAALAVIAFIAVTLNEKGYLVKGINQDHYYSLGALMFAFTNFWAYIAFSQFMLIWYANIPEETFWMIERFHGTLKDRTKVMRGLKSVDTAIQFADGFLAYYNYLRPHEKLEGRTPAEVAEVDCPLKTWADVIQTTEPRVEVLTTPAKVVVVSEQKPLIRPITHRSYKFPKRRLRKRKSPVSAVTQIIRKRS